MYRIRYSFAGSATVAKGSITETVRIGAGFARSYRPA